MVERRTENPCVASSILALGTNQKALFVECFLVGAGEGNRTPVSRLETCGNNHYTTPARLICVGNIEDFCFVGKAYRVSTGS